MAKSTEPGPSVSPSVREAIRRLELAVTGSSVSYEHAYHALLAAIAAERAEPTPTGPPPEPGVRETTDYGPRLVAEAQIRAAAHDNDRDALVDAMAGLIDAVTAESAASIATLTARAEAAERERDEWKRRAIEPCQVIPVRSNVCARGTTCCVVDHRATPTPNPKEIP